MHEVSLYAASKAKERHVNVMLDAGRARPGMLEIARLCDFVVTSEEFAKDLGWKLNKSSLLKEKENLKVQVLTITLGNRGSISVSNGELLKVPAFKVDAIDTTGAGDVFHGGYIYGLLQNWNLRNTITFAAALAAMKCTKIGGRAGIPSFNEVKRFLSQRGHNLEK